MVVLWLGLSLSSFSKHNALSYRYYGWVCRCCHQSVKTIYGRIIVGSVVVVRQKHNMWWYYGLVCCCFCPSLNTTCGRNKFGFVVGK